MRIIAINTLTAYAEQHPETAMALAHWRQVARRSAWKSPMEVIASFGKAKVISEDRIRFEVAGGNYRLIVAFDFLRQIAFIKFIGTHAEYDAIDAKTVSKF
ncbi:type II toxin-antitoxin system HigB family toxin [Beijerinckia mobilis]|uniref:type II toxin-antitoxin system HigB family toxin n=1 Tax=Beijerinckia mobilis TaxID=231434 RepID=UPI0005569583|nr:type II toxin-antitoxin system HigB family toxin [Beijerinckia mobilis]